MGLDLVSKEHVEGETADHVSKEHVGAAIYCRRSTLAKHQDRNPVWHSCGPLGTEGVEGETADQDSPETWGWTLSDVVLSSAAVQAHLPE